MDSCKICSKTLDAGRVITCSGSCGLSFHFPCVGLTKPHYTAWTTKNGLLWFCKFCRLNFDPAVYDREKTIMKALRELLIRTDSMDTRLGNYGENLRKVNKTLYGSQLHSKSKKPSDQTTFLQRIDELNIDDSVDDPIDRSRSCEETSFFEVLDEINSSIAHIPDKFIVGSNKRVQIVAKQSSGSGRTPQINVSTPAASTQPPNPSGGGSRPVLPLGNDSDTSDAHTDHLDGSNSNDNPESNRIALRVANGSQTANDVESFYVTPFDPDQNEEEVKKYVMDISNVHSTRVKVTKLVPRGRRIEDLSFVSFKVTVCKTAATVVGDPWYWPDGISVRNFEPNSKNGSAARLPNT